MPREPLRVKQYPHKAQSQAKHRQGCKEEAHATFSQIEYLADIIDCLDFPDLHAQRLPPEVPEVDVEQRDFRIEK